MLLLLSPDTWQKKMSLSLTILLTVPVPSMIDVLLLSPKGDLHTNIWGEESSNTKAKIVRSVFSVTFQNEVFISTGPAPAIHWWSLPSYHSIPVRSNHIPYVSGPSWVFFSSFNTNVVTLPEWPSSYPCQTATDMIKGGRHIAKHFICVFTHKLLSPHIHPFFCQHPAASLFCALES